MTIHVCPRTHLRKAGKSAARRIAVALCGALLLSGCGDSAPSLLAVKAVAAGVASLAPFFDEGEQLGRDEPRLTPLTPHSGLQQGNAPGLYGGTQKPTVCDVRKLEDFLAAPENEKKAQEWARVTGVKVDGIGRYLDSLTPVLLRHDTLVKNHDYKKGRAVPFDALLEAGIAVLVDDQGLPAVKCSCGNPLRAFDADPGRIDVDFPGDKEWKGYDASGVVVVEPSPERLKEIKLVDVEDPGRGISRAVGTTGESDTTFDARARQAVPTVRGMTFGEASAALADRGLAATVAGGELPPDGTPVTGSSPGPGAELEFGAEVALRVEEPGGTPEESSGDPGLQPGSSGPGSTRLGPTEPSESGGSPPDGAPSESGSTPADGNTPPAGGGSSPSADGSSHGGTTPGTGSSDGGPSGSGSSDSGPPDGGSSGSGSSDGGPPGGGSSDGGSPGGGSAAGGPEPAESVTPPTTGATPFVPSPSTSFEKPAPEPDPTPSPSVPSPASGLSTSSRTPAAPEPGDPTDPTDPTGEPRWPGLPVEAPAQPPVRI
ncbi:PASTA domain-containing protein [Streptomyces scabiei]|uniref:PASTA domain protein n=2 Tax=Streptomyces TaxID=1883 RepID=A0A117EDG9_STRSC|nr:PASTA domain-containing protein [Streptomyces scabiei]GAQ62453.1 PASTA domain protein [Streptomyces scabiei]